MHTNTTENLRRLSEAEMYIFDMDGTVCLGETAFPDAVEFINSLHSRHKDYAFFTNNTSRDTAYYLRKLSRMGFHAESRQVVSSAEVTGEFLNRHRPGAGVYVVGNEYLLGALRRMGIRLVDTSPDVVLTSFDTSLTYEKLERACTFIRRGAEWLSTHPDVNCPTEDGFIPDSGAINAAVSASVGGAQPRYFGKPYPEAAAMLCSMYTVQPSQMVIFGDRLYTDIALGKRNGILAALVLTGETTLEMVEKACPEDRPDLIFDRIRLGMT